MRIRFAYTDPAGALPDESLVVSLPNRRSNCG